ncbi:hypothetical protein LTR62_007600 [Meristemomyces frigidus]|uniref:Uncharacterized protein n=1 Tax=Meristemomyces frigidus TaxID=1508187 RepID=A0AAN7TBH7_9PEZI|nr:hypothetical protein LTR62_007600 [Meristemomyces frigidus]
MASLARDSLVSGSGDEDEHGLGRLQHQGGAFFTKNPEPTTSPASLLPGKVDSSYGSRWRRRTQDTCIFELASLLLSAAAFSTLVAILSLYDGKPLSNFVSSTTINTVISVLITLAEFSLVFPVSEALCQHQWMHMRGTESGGKPVSDLQDIDRAAFSSVAAFNVLTRGRKYSTVVLLGALAMVAHLLVGPFPQQAIRYPARTAALSQTATITRTQTLSGQSETTGFDQSTINAALDAGWTHASLLPKYTCSNGDCSWQPFPSVGMCSKCVDVTADIQQECGIDDTNSSVCNMVFPGGIRVPQDDGSYAFTKYYQDAWETISYNTSKAPQDNTIAREIQSNCSFADQFGGRLGDLALLFAGLASYQGGALDVPVTALECALYVYVNNYTNVAIVNGTYQAGNTTEIAGQTAQYHVPITAPPQFFPFRFNASIALNAPTSPPWSPNYDIETATLGWATDGIFTLFRANSSSTNAEPAWTVSMDAWSKQQWLLPNYDANYSALVPQMLDSVANTITTMLRNQGAADQFDSEPSTVLGTVWGHEAFIQVRWLWLILPRAVIVLGVVFVIATIVQRARSGFPTWKSSVLALMFHGLDDVSIAEDESLDTAEYAKRCETSLSGSEVGMRRRLTRIY